MIRWKGHYSYRGEHFLNIAIIEDSINDSDILYGYIKKYYQKNNLFIKTTTYNKGEEFLVSFQKDAFDLIFIDIYLGKVNGMDIAEKIHILDQECLLVFSTTSKSHAIDSFRVRAFHYLVKPYNYIQLEEVMNLCTAALRKKSYFITVKESRIFVKILLDTIIYTDYSNHYIQIHTKERLIKSYISFQDFSILLLSYPQFINCYRNCIINMDEVASLTNKDFIMSTGEIIPITRSSRLSVRQQYADYVFQSSHKSF